MSIQDTKERIFRNGQVYSRPRFGDPDTRPPFRPDSNPYDVPPEPRGYGQGSVDVPALRDLLFRPTDKFDIRNPVYRPEDKVEVLPLAPETGKRGFLYQYLEQNKEVMGPKNQMFGRYANPDDGTLNNDEMAQLDPTGELLLRSLRKGEIGPLTDPNIQKAIRDLERQKYNRGRASSMDGDLMAADPSFAIPREVSPAEVREINRRVISDYDKKKEKLRRGFLSPLLRGV